MAEPANYSYRGARAMVILHERHMRSCLASWKQAKALAITLPETEDADYESLETLLAHILRAARNYMVWMCKHLDLPDPEIKPAPELDRIATEADAYLEHLLERWGLPLAEVEEERFYRPEYPSNWQVLYCIDAMLEHAVMHPIRHQFQLEELMAQQG
ncbi:MAG: hypothetical protein KC422_16395 [Trueperaceae bacterium]|nr:hypothetical protein [Trueperaceae bacterium]